jgi:D-inositol-3-phosphate glycosyltransferase
MFCDGTGVRLPHEGAVIWRLLSRLRRSLSERTALNLGALVATRSLYLAFLEHYASGEVFLLPTPGAESGLRKEIDWLRQQGKVHPQTTIIGWRELSQLALQRRLHCFDPRSTRAELLDVRRAYCTKPVPVTWTHHSISYRHCLGETFLPLLLSDSLPCDSIICSSSAARKALSNMLELIASRLPVRDPLYKGRLDLIPFGVKTSEFRPLEQRRCRRIFDLPFDATTFLYFGRISSSDKGDLVPLAMAFAHLRREIKAQRTLLVIAGNPREGQAEDLKRELRDRGLTDSVRFVSHVSEAEKPLLYGAADAFVSPSESIQECFGLVILEAMACGLPQIVSDWNGYRDLVAQGETGFLVPTIWAECDDMIIRNGTMYPTEWQTDHFQLGQSVAVDVRKLSTALLELAKNRELRLRMSAASRARAVALFDWKHIVRRYEELWTELDAIAIGLPDFHGPDKSYRIPGYFQCFQHYSTTNLDEGSWLLWEEFGVARHGDQIVLPYPNLFKGFDPFADWNLPELEAVFKQAQGPIRVAEILNKTSRHGEPAEILRQVMWLLKYGYLRIIPGDQHCDGSPKSDV